MHDATQHPRIETGRIAAAVVLALPLLLVAGCSEDAADEPSGEGGWLTGDAQQRFDMLADQQGGFSPTMVEVGYRYTELYWAGEDENWEFAAYQIEHIEEALEAGFQRRPEHRPSAEPFLTQALPDVTEAVEQQDRTMFRERIDQLRTHCNACHALEDVSFVHVKVPTERFRPWGLD